MEKLHDSIVYTTRMAQSYKNSTEAKAGLTSAFGSNTTPAQQAAIDRAASLVPSTPTDAASLGQSTPMSLTSTPQVTTPDINTLQVSAPAAPQPAAPTQAATFTDKLSGLVAKITGKEADKTAQVEADTQPFRKQLNELNTQIKLHQANSIAREEAALNRVGGTLSSNAIDYQQNRRTDAIEGLKLAAFAEAMQGNISIAETHAKAAVDAKYAEMEREIQTTKNNIYNNWESFTASEKKRAEATLLQIDKDDALVARQKEEDKAILAVGMKLSEYGVDMKTVQSVLESGDYKKALMLAGSKLQDPKAKIELENLRLETTLKKADIAKKSYELQLLKKYNGLTPTEYRKKLEDEAKEVKAAKEESDKSRIQAEQLGGKITLLDSVLNSSAIDSVVGPTPLSRSAGSKMGVFGRFAAGAALGGAAGAPFSGVGAIPGALIGGTLLAAQGVGDAFGAADTLIGQTEQFISKEFLQNLIDVKAAGATFGALTQKEQEALTAAATYIGQRRICGGESGGVCKEGSRVTNYDMSESDFKREIKKIQDMARLAQQRATGKTFTPDEQGVLDDIYGTDTPTANYYGIQL